MLLVDVTESQNLAVNQSIHSNRTINFFINKESEHAVHINNE